MDICCFSIVGEDYTKKRNYIGRNEMITNGQYRMLIVKFIPFENRSNPFPLKQIGCGNLIRFDIANEDGPIFDAVTMNGQLKIRTLKKIIKYRYHKGGECSVINYLNEIMFNDYSQLEHFYQYFPIIQVKFYDDNSEDITIKCKNGEFKTQISIRDNF
jgi:hypothetical protein